jgi:hypothetical protein
MNSNSSSVWLVHNCPGAHKALLMKKVNGLVEPSPECGTDPDWLRLVPCSHWNCPASTSPHDPAIMGLIGPWQASASPVKDVQVTW